MTKYAIIDERNDETFETFFATEEEAISAAEREWSRMSRYDRSRRNTYCVALVQLDEEYSYDVVDYDAGYDPILTFTDDFKIVPDAYMGACIKAAESCSEFEEYIEALDQDWEGDCDAPITGECVDALRNIWDAYHRSVRQIAADAGMSCRDLAKRFGIPYRTMEDWCAERRKCPTYTRLMMQECLFLLRRQ